MPACPIGVWSRWAPLSTTHPYLGLCEVSLPGDQTELLLQHLTSLVGTLAGRQGTVSLSLELRGEGRWQAEKMTFLLAAAVIHRSAEGEYSFSAGDSLASQLYFSSCACARGKIRLACETMLGTIGSTEDFGEYLCNVFYHRYSTLCSARLSIYGFIVC